MAAWFATLVGSGVRLPLLPPSKLYRIDLANATQQVISACNLSWASRAQHQHNFFDNDCPGFYEIHRGTSP